ncbi:acyltransferase family protein [Enterococcus gallinarum]|nr:acyltransferase family protein [Enterococcus gallinarum]
MYPFLLFSLLIFILIAGSIQIRMLGNIKSELPSLLFGYNNWWQIHEKVSYFDRFANSSLFKHYWSLAVELQFYLVFPLFFLTVMRLSRKRGYQLMYLLTIISILTSLLSPFSIAYYNTFARLYPFIVGMFGFFNRKNINDVISSKK